MHDIRRRIFMKNLFCARGAPEFFGNFEISFARVRRKTCVIPTPDAFFFGSECNADWINSQRRRKVIMRSSRPSERSFCARSVPDFRNFCKIFARVLRNHLDAGLALYLALERTPTRRRAATKLCGSRTHAGRVHATFVRAARRNFSETFKKFSRKFGAKFA